MKGRTGAIADRAWRLPWVGQWVPHGLLDILRGCDISCRACYNVGAARARTTEEVRSDLEVLRRERRLDALAIVGGEPTLHPQLCAIVRMIKEAGISVELFTNGLRATPKMLSDLKAAGVDMVFLHIDAYQRRGDLAAGAGAEALRALRVKKAEEVAAAGMEAGLVMTAYGDGLEEIEAAAELVLDSPTLDYLVVTFHRDTPGLGVLRGDLAAGICGCAGMMTEVGTGLSQVAVAARMKERFGLDPFAFVGSNVDANDPRWVTYLAVAVTSARGKAFFRAMRPTCVERGYVALCRRIKGRYPFFVRRAAGKLRLQLLLNMLAGGGVGNAAVLARSGAGRLRVKRIVFQTPAELGNGGELIHCAHCPDATVKNGRLVPVCVCDQVENVAEKGRRSV